MFFIIIAISFLFLALAVHELNHGKVMRLYGIEVPEAGLGIPSGLPSIRIRISPSFIFRIHPLLLGAYVRPVDEKRIETLSYSKKAHIYGAGVIANLMMAALFFAIYLVILMATNWESLTWKPFVFFGVALVSLMIFWLGQKIISSHIFPFLGFALAIFLIWSIAKSGVGGTIVGPVGIVQLSLSITTIEEAVYWGYVISLGLALINLLPIFPFDGGRIFLSLIEKLFGKNQKVERTMTVVGILVIILLFTTVMYSDISRVLS